MSWFAERGIACHAIDLRGHGRSSGRRAYVQQWDEYLDDLQQFLGSIEGAGTPIRPRSQSRWPGRRGSQGVRGLLSRFHVRGCILTAPYFINALPIPRYKLIGAYVANIVCPWLQIRSGVKSDLTTRDPLKAEESRNDPLLLRFATPRWFFGASRRSSRDARERAAIHASAARRTRRCGSDRGHPRGARISCGRQDRRTSRLSCTRNFGTNRSATPGVSAFTRTFFSGLSNERRSARDASRAQSMPNRAARPRVGRRLSAARARGERASEIRRCRRRLRSDIPTRSAVPSRRAPSRSSQILHCSKNRFASRKSRQRSEMPFAPDSVAREMRSFTNPHPVVASSRIVLDGGLEDPHLGHF